MSEAEAKRFRSNARWRDAVELRIWDDEAKIADMNLPEFEEWLPLIGHVSMTFPAPMV